MVETDPCRRVLCSEKFKGVTAEGSRGEQEKEQEGSGSEADRESAEADASGGSERSQSSCADSLPTRASERPSLSVSAIGLRSPPCFPTRGQVGAAYPVGEGYPPVLAPFQRRPFSSTQV